jgi:lactoylglutathione lyase
MGFLTGHELTWMLEALQILPDELPNIDVMISSQYSPQLADAFNVPLAELLAASERLNAAGIQTQNLADEKTTEPSVIGWMPSAQLYFRDRDGHSVEFITLLDESPEPEFVGSLSEWKKRSHAG